MSLCLIIQNKDQIIISGDSRACREDNGVTYAVDDDVIKIHHVGDKIIFMGGNQWVADETIKRYVTSKETSIDSLNKVGRSVVEEFEKVFPKAAGMFARKFEAVIATFENGVSVIYSLSSFEGYRIFRVEADSKETIAAIGAHRNTAIEMYKNLKHITSINNRYEVIYDTVADESVGGNLTIYTLTMNECKKYDYKIKDSRQIKKYEFAYGNEYSIGPDVGFVAERSDKKTKVEMNATEGISIYSDSGSGLEKNFFVDTDGRIKAKNIDIEGSGTFGGNITAANVTMHNGSGTGSLNFNLGIDQYIVLKTSYTTNGNTLIIGKSGIVGGTPSKMERIDIMAGTLYLYDNLYVAENVTCLKINDVDASDYLHSENLSIIDNLDFTTLAFYGKEIMSVQDLTVPKVFLSKDWIFEGNVCGTVQQLTQAEANAKTDWLPNQLVEITDVVLPLITDDLTASSTMTDVTLKVNAIIQALDGWILRRE
jgi:hypothetical protein